VLEHDQESRVGFDHVAVAADTRDADRRPLEDGTVVSFAAAERLRGVRAADELPDLHTCCRKHRDLVVLDPAHVLRKQLDHTDYHAAVEDRESED